MRAEPLARGPEGGWEGPAIRGLTVWLGRETEAGPGCGSNRAGREGTCLPSPSFPNSKFGLGSSIKVAVLRASVSPDEGWEPV